MRGRRPDNGGGRGRGRGTRDLSPATRTKVHRPNWHRNHLHHNRSSNRSTSPPPMRDRAWRLGGRRSPSVDHRGYAHTHSRRGDHGKQHLRSPDPRGQLSPFERKRYELPPDYMLPDHPSGLNLPEMHTGLKPSRVVPEREYLQQGNGGLMPSSPRTEMQNVLLQKSVHSDGGAAREVYALQQDTSYAMDAKIGSDFSTLNVGVRDYPNHLRDPYNERDRVNQYSKELSYAAPLLVRPPDGASSASYAKDDLLGLYDDRRPQTSDRFVRSALSNFSEDHLDRDRYTQVQLSDPVRRGHITPAYQNEPRDYGYRDLSQKERISHGYFEMDEMVNKSSWSPHGDYRDKFGSSFSDLARGRIEEMGASRKFTNESNLWDQHGDKTLDYPETKGVHDGYAGSSATTQLGFEMKPLKGYECASFEDDYVRVRDAAPVRYREAPRNTMFSDDHHNMYKRDISPQRGNADVDNLYDVAPQRMTRNYDISNDIGATEREGFSLNDQPAFKRIHSASASDRIHYSKEKRGGLHSKKVPFGHIKYGMTSHRTSSSETQFQSADSPNEDYGHGMSLKRRLRPNPSEIHGSYHSDKKKFRPKKFWKRDMEDGYAMANANEEDVPDNDPVIPKCDPPIGSGLFTQQVHKAFLKYSKELNDSPEQQKTYQDQGGGNFLRCFVCGSLSKEFADTHSLVMHTYHSKKVGIRTEHLGLHKALCVLMGWNWTIAPDSTNKAYQSTPLAEAKALKADLILWPPVVILHNSSMTIKSSKNERKLVTDKDMEEMLREIGFETGKTQVSRGKPANSVFLVKFLATLSGMQEAERLHRYFADKSLGKEAFQQFTANNSSTEVSGGSRLKKAEHSEQLPYGYMATADDLHKLDSETKKRCLVKSKKDIEAIADAPLNID